MYGFGFAFLLILLILFPILLFSGFNPITNYNPVLSGSININFEINENGNIYDIFKTDAFGLDLINET